MKGDPIGDELRALHRKHEGLLTPAQIHDWAAKHPGSAIAARLEWDNDIAGHAYRLWQIRELVATHLVLESGEREWVSLSVDQIEQGGYRDLTDVLQDETLRSIWVRDALDELGRFERRFSQIEELKGVFRAAKAARKRFEDGDEGAAA
jgi:hypothetical protein